MTDPHLDATTEAAEALLHRILDDLEVDASVTALPHLLQTRGTEAEKAHWLAEVETLILTCQVDLQALADAARRLLEVALPTHAYEAATVAGNAFICAGLYEQALKTEAWALARAGRAPQDDEGQGALLQINLAEADYNLGHWEVAERRLAALDEADLGDVPLLVGGLRCQSAWIAAERKDLAPVQRYLDTFDEDWLPPLFRAELFYCKAICHRALGDHAAAHEALATGRAAAVRASSVRNGHFLQAQLLVDVQRLEEANAEYAKGAAHAYKGQGGSAYLGWGDLLMHRLGRPDEARAAWRLAVERDPESAAAREAESRLRT